MKRETIGEIKCSVCYGLKEDFCSGRLILYLGQLI